MTVTLYSGVVVSTPTTLTDTIKVSVPDLKAPDRRSFGPLRFNPTVSGSGGTRLPQAGDSALIGVDEETGGQWVVSWYRDDDTAPPYSEVG
jgi:hypothetical protein